MRPCISAGLARDLARQCSEGDFGCSKSRQKTGLARELICGKLKAFDLRELNAQFRNREALMLRRELSSFPASRP